jgi:hypothetical protein
VSLSSGICPKGNPSSRISNCITRHNSSTLVEQLQLHVVIRVKKRLIRIKYVNQIMKTRQS